MNSVPVFEQTSHCSHLEITVYYWIVVNRIWHIAAQSAKNSVTQLVHHHTRKEEQFGSSFKPHINCDGELVKLSVFLDQMMYFGLRSFKHTCC